MNYIIIASLIQIWVENCHAGAVVVKCGTGMPYTDKTKLKKVEPCPNVNKTQKLEDQQEKADGKKGIFDELESEVEKVFDINMVLKSVKTKN